MLLRKGTPGFSKGALPAVLGIAMLLLAGCSGSSPLGNPAATSPSLIFSTYLGGSQPCPGCTTARTFGQNAASDAAGNTYVTGATEAADLPVTNQTSLAPGATLAAFVAKYDPSGKLLWCTYLGGNGKSMGTGAAVTPLGGVAVVGITNSAGAARFPTTPNAYQSQNAGSTDYFVSVYDASGNLLYSTYLGGSGDEGDNTFSDDNSNGNNIAVDAQGLVYITGTTNSGGGGGGAKFPVTSNALQSDMHGPTDAILAIINPAASGASSLVYSSFLGGAKNEKGHGVAVDPTGSLIVVVGYTDSDDFPVTPNAFRQTHPASGWTSNGIITEFKSDTPGSLSSSYSMTYSTYLGGKTSAARDDAYAVTLTPAGIIVATGRTESADFFTPVLPVPSIYNTAPDPKATSRNDQPYIVKIAPTLSGTASLVYGTFLGGGSTTGGGGAFCTGVVVDAAGSTYVGGETDSTGVLYQYSSSPAVAPELFPYTSDALRTSLQGSFDAVFMQVGPDGGTLTYSTFLGGTDSDRAYGIAVDALGNVAVSGLTFSSNFPTVNAWQPKPNNLSTGKENAFVAKFGRGTVR